MFYVPATGASARTKSKSKSKSKKGDNETAKTHAFMTDLVGKWFSDPEDAP